MAVNDAALPEDSTAGGKGCKGNKTCGKSLSEEVGDLPTKRCYTSAFKTILFIKG